MISKEQIENMANLAKLKFSEEELEKSLDIISTSIENIKILNSVDTENIEPTYEINNHIQFLREDMVKDGLTREEVLQNSIENQYGYFKLFKIVE